ncbi:MAG: histidine kinase dimerization/phosphoacceptor domain -containing protein [Imperialibacter sp.]|uniref:tetratricopeptide repeat-containing sensor histidine kinase n=1 Tax=Imperialibacter sp. TaxID=2038411 RepID=UPI0030DC8C60|tara:strand:- start:677 stop:2512 length:1836 start_codon:yes stop_codon:yes gene_type:complete
MLKKAHLLALLLLSCTISNAQESLPEVISQFDTIQNPGYKLKLIKLGENLLQKEGDDSIKAEFFLRCGITYGISGKADSSIYFFNQALQLGSEAQHLLKSRAHNGIGNVSRQKGNNEMAFESFQNALKEVEGKPDFMSQSFEGSIIANLASIYFSMGDNEKAEQYSLRGLEHAKSISDTAQMEYSYVGLALIYNKTKEYEKALEYHQLASLLMERENSDPYLRDYNTLNLAKLHENRGELARALSLYDEMLQSTNPDVDIRTSSLKNASQILFTLEDYAKAIDYAERLMSLANETATLPSAVDATQLLYQSYQATGDYKTANKYLNSYVALNDSLINEKSLKALAELETKYESEKKAQEITELKLENQQSVNQRNIYLFVTLIVIVGAVFLGVLIRSKTKSNKLISKSLKDKELLLKEIHHRVKNNLQIISSLLSLQSRYIEDKGAKDAVNEGQNRVKAMALIHQKLYQNENLAGVEALDYIENLTSTLRSSYGVGPERVSVSYDIENLNIDVDTIIPIGLILNELISNSFKHAFPNDKEGNISIALKRANNQLELKVCDNGVGSKKDISKSDSFGIRMIRSLAMKLEATVSFNFDNGTEASLLISSFKLA